MRDPFEGCRTGSLICLIGSQPKQVLKMSANSSVVPSFCKRGKRFIRFFVVVPISGMSTATGPGPWDTHLAVAENVKQQRQTLGHELLTVVVRADLQEVLQQLIDDGIEAQLVCGREGMHPAVQCPWYA